MAELTLAGIDPASIRSLGKFRAAVPNSVDFVANKSHCGATMNVATEQEMSPSNAKLRRLVGESGLKHGVIAQRGRIRPDVLSQLLSGARTFTWYYAARLAPVFGVPMETFIDFP